MGSKNPNRQSVFSDPKQAAFAGWMVVGLLSVLALLIRMALDFDGVLDTDVMNFGLSAYRFDLMAHQPHPPGYPGYVMFLKLIHACAPLLSPVDVAKWGTRICGVLVIPATYWTARSLCKAEKGSGVGPSLWAAGFAVFHPILWFYGGDGQSHAAEALLTLVLVALTLRVKSSDSDWFRLGLVVIFALAGSVRPTIALLSSPLLVWVYWRRPLYQWALAGCIGVLAVALWYVPLVYASGGLDLYRRATRALVKELFINNYSILGTRSSWRMVLLNLSITTISTLLALIPMLAAEIRRESSFIALAAVIVVNYIFYAMMFTAEPGYLASVAAIATLSPATWRGVQTTRLRIASVGVIGLSFWLVWFGPANVKVPGLPATFLPTMQHVVNISESQQFHQKLLCDTSQGRPTLVLTDNPVTTHNRWLPMRCPNITVALYLHNFFLRTGMDNWLIYTSDDMLSIPTEVPLELGPPSSLTLPYAELIMITPGTTKEWRHEVLAASTCQAVSIRSEGLLDEKPLLVLPASCLPTLRFGRNILGIETKKD